MSTQPDDDLDSTAELPQLELSSASSTGTVQFDLADIAGGLQVDPAAHWDLMDELISVRDKIVGLENALTEAEIKLTKLQSRHDTLQGQHADLLTHSQTVARDRDRLAEERLLWLTAKQQLEEQAEQQRSTTATEIAHLQSALAAQQRSSAELEQTLQAQRADSDARGLAHVAALAELQQCLQVQQQRGDTLSAELQGITQQLNEQHTAAATLARSVAVAAVEKNSLEALLSGHAQRSAALQATLTETQQQLGAAQSHGQALQRSITEHQTQAVERSRQLTDLQHTLTVAEERIERLVAQVDTENSHWRSAEQDKERLRQTADEEHQTVERTRHELSERQTEISTLQDKLSRATLEIDALNQQLVERHQSLKQQEQTLHDKQRESQNAQHLHAAALQREVGLNETLGLLRGELRQTQTELRQQTVMREQCQQQLDSEQQALQQLRDELHGVRQQHEQNQALLQKRDSFILDQERELEVLRGAKQMLSEQIQQRDQGLAAQAERLAAVTTQLQQLQHETTQHSGKLQQAQQDIQAKDLQHVLHARQIETLQAELRQQVEAMNAIRRDIHQVALQTRPREAEAMVRTLTRIDTDVVHLLNKPSMIIGRGRDADICIKSDSISRQHACLRISRDAVIVEDMTSTNGCYVNGRRVKRHLLKDGDRVELGDIPLKFTTRAVSSP